MGPVTRALPVQEDRDLYSGIKNIASSYFDTTSQHNRHGEPRKHFSFQTVRGEAWKEAVADILEDNPITEKLGGTDGLKKGLKGALNLAGGEATLTSTIVEELIDLVVDKAVDSFTQPDPVQEDFEAGTWIYIDRGKHVTKLHERQELAAEFSMFQDSDDVLTQDVATRKFVPGFYVQHVEETNVSIVYAYDTEQPMEIAYSKIRRASPEDSAAFDDNKSMTLIRELYFLRADKDNVPYCKFQLGDEVIVQGEPYTVIKAAVDAITIEDVHGNRLTVDPQAATKGESDHWRATEPGMFRNAEYTFTPGDFAYREIVAQDEPPNSMRATGVLCCIQAIKTDERVIIVDVWTGTPRTWDPRTIIKPPLVIRRALEQNVRMKLVRKHTIAGTESMAGELAGPHHSDIESWCFGYGITMEFPRVNLWGAPVVEKAIDDPIILDHTIVKPFDQIETKPPEPSSETGIWYIAGAAILLGVLYAHGVE